MLGIGNILSFHYKDGIYFSRKDDGTVILKIFDSALPNAELKTKIEFDPDSWCSIISHVSKEGESSAKFEDANKFHLE